MKLCKNCGAPIASDAAVCVRCGTVVSDTNSTKTKLSTATFIFLLISVIMIALDALCWLILGLTVSNLFLWFFPAALVPLVWAVPMTVSYQQKLVFSKPVGMGFRICTLLFVSMISGILMLCDTELRSE